MLKICDVSICKHLEIILRTCLNHGKYREEWKKANVVPVFKKSDKKCVNLISTGGKGWGTMYYRGIFLSRTLERQMILN